jgi:hypothetical protein
MPGMVEQRMSRQSTRWAATAALATAAHTSIANAQCYLQVFDGGDLRRQFGFSVALLANAAPGGIAALAIGEPGPYSGWSGYIWVYSTLDGSLLSGRQGEHVDSDYGFAVAALGDVDGDGADDLIVGAPGYEPYGRAYVYSGATHHRLCYFEGMFHGDGLGMAVSGVQDLDGDATPDILVGVPGFDGYTQAGAIFVYSGATGDLIGIVEDPTYTALGSHVSDLGDIDGDGYGDFLCSMGQRVIAVSGRTFGEIWNIHEPDNTYGDAISGLGDVDGDGIPDFAASAPAFSDPHWLGGKVWVYSGATGEVIWERDAASDDERLGTCLGRSGDIDGDGRADIIVTTTDEVQIISPFHDRVLRRFNNIDGWGGEVSSVAGVADADGDGRPDIAIGLRLGGFDGGGQAYVYKGWPTADFNADATVNSQDFTAFLNEFAAGGRWADQNGDGTVNSQDFVAFLNAFVAGC